MTLTDSDGSDSPRSVGYDSFKSQYQNKSYIQTYVNNNRFPFRPTINMALIILITFQVYIVASSHMYLRGSLTRSFLQMYVDDQKYPQLYQGLAFYLTIRNISEVKENLIYTFNAMQQMKNNSFLIMDMKYAKITLSVQYLNNLQNKHLQKQFIIDPQKGIIEPFNMQDITQIQTFLIQINWFKLIVENITVESEGFYQKYFHQVIYDFEEGLQVVVNYKFSIDNAMLNSMTIDKPQANYLFVIRVFHLVILLLAVFSIYLNYRYIRRTMKVIFQQLGKKKVNQNDIHQSLVNAQDMAQINEAVLKWIQVNKLTLQKLTFRHYFYILEFDIIFSTISNFFTIVGSFYLFIGLQRQIIVGISCLTSWMTIFKFLRRKKKLVLMYELIKLSIIKVMFFFIEFFPVFLAYTFLGLCLFPKVQFFSQLSKSVTTLVSLMMGDSIQLITSTMNQKNSQILVVLYIFSFVLLFMHAIHNTLTSLIKQAFILKKIELIKEQKKQKKESDFIYISQIKCSADEEKDQLPILLTSSLKKDMIRVNHLKKSKVLQSRIKKWVHVWQKFFFHQKWQIQQNETILLCHQYLTQLKRRIQKIDKLSGRLFGQDRQQSLSLRNNETGQSLITNE